MLSYRDILDKLAAWEGTHVIVTVVHNEVAVLEAEGVLGPLEMHTTARVDRPEYEHGAAFVSLGEAQAANVALPGITLAAPLNATGEFAPREIMVGGPERFPALTIHLDAKTSLTITEVP